MRKLEKLIGYVFFASVSFVLAFGTFVAYLSIFGIKAGVRDDYVVVVSDLKTDVDHQSWSNNFVADGDTFDVQPAGGYRLVQPSYNPMENMELPFVGVQPVEYHQ